MSLLDLLGAVLSPDLNPVEVAELRDHLHRRRASTDPSWESGLIAPNVNERPETERLRAQVAELELTVKVLGDLLVERGVLEPGALAGRVGAVRVSLARDARARVEAERQHAETARRAADEARRATVIQCASCAAAVRQSESYLSSRGALCLRCHSAQDE